MIRRPSRCLLLVCAMAAGGIAHAAPPTGPFASPSPAIGYDWMDPSDPVDAYDDPDPWPRADAADSGLNDLIHDERRPIAGAITGTTTGATAGRSIGGGTPDQHILRTLRKVGGDYIVVPLLTLHLDRPAAP